MLDEQSILSKKTITLTGSLLDVHDVLPADRTILYTVNGSFDVTSDLTACLFLSAFEKVHAIACPMSRVARELKADMTVKRCPNSGKCHIAVRHLLRAAHQD